MATQSTNKDSTTLGEVEKQLRVRNRILESMLALGRAVSAELQMEPLCDLVVARLAQTLDAEAITLYFSEQATGELFVKRTFGVNAPVAEGSTRRSAAQAAFRSEHVVCHAAQPVVAGDAAEREPVSLVAVPLKLDAVAAQEPEQDATAAVPLKAENKIKGVITITWPTAARRPTDDDLRLLEVLAGQIAPAIDNAWLYGQLKELNAGLEARVQARTRQLAESNAHLRLVIDELKQAQAQLVQSEKMASLGQLSAGIAHEINNPLAYAISNTAIAGERLKGLRRRCALLTATAEAMSADQPGARRRAAARFIETLRADGSYSEDVIAFEADLVGLPVAEQAALSLDFLRYVAAREQQTGTLDQVVDGIGGLLGRTRDGLERVKGIVLDLRSFSRLDEAQYLAADIDAGIASTLSIVAHLAKDRGVTLEQQRGLSQPYACFSAKLNQVVLNLVTNALQATSSGGRVRVRTWQDATGVFIEVLDTGAGIAPEHMIRIFDPFFTTKPVGQGTGLGLSISYQVIQEHRGTIRASSKPGEGSCFTICLPPRTD
jgi:signal transduction histidine kinase